MSEQLAQRFHAAYERLAPQFGYKTRDASAVPWDCVPDNNKQLMIAVCDEIESNWIRVTPDSLPPLDTAVLVYYRQGMGFVYRVTSRIERGWLCAFIPTHWQFLPKPPFGD